MYREDFRSCKLFQIELTTLERRIVSYLYIYIRLIFVYFKKERIANIIFPNNIYIYILNVQFIPLGFIENSFKFDERENKGWVDFYGISQEYRPWLPCVT